MLHGGVVERKWSRAVAPLLMLALIACDREREAEPAAAADSVSVESPETVRDLLAPVRSVGLAAIEFGDMAAQRAQREDVRQYAQTVATDHRALIAVLDSAALARRATLSETPSSQELNQAVRMAHSGLETLPPADFDQAYIRAQLETHRQLLDRLDTQILPALTSADLRTLATDTRAMVDAHLTRARQILAGLLGQPAEPPQERRRRLPAPTPTSPAPTQPDTMPGE